MKNYLPIILMSIVLNAETPNWFPMDSTDDIGDSQAILQMTPSTSVLPKNSQDIPQTISPNTLSKKAIFNKIKNEQFYKNHTHVKEHYLRGTIKKSTYYLKDKKDGLETEYYTNGTIMVTTYYVNGLKHGVETIYDANGKAYKQTFYREGIKQWETNYLSSSWFMH